MRAPLTGCRRKDGRWQIVLSLDQPDGVTKRKTVYGATQREVQEKARAFLMLNGRTVYDSHTWEDLWTLWKTTEAPKLKPATIEQWEWAWKRILPAFGDKDPRDLTAPTFKRFLNAVAADPKLGGRSVQIVRNVCGGLMRLAVEEGWATNNPVRDVGTPVSAVPIEKKRVTEGVYRRIVETEPTDVLRLAWELMGECGLRPSEVLNLEPQDVIWSMDQGWVKVRDSKTAAGAGREVPMPDSLWRALSEREGPKIVGTEKGTLMSRDNLTRAWKRALKRVEAEDCPMYSLRKLAISRWVGRGVAPEAVKGLAGHADYRLTLNVYARLGRDRLLFSVGEGGCVTSMSELTGPVNEEGPI